MQNREQKIYSSQGTTVRLRSRDDDMCNALKKSECVDFRERIARDESPVLKWVFRAVHCAGVPARYNHKILGQQSY